MRSWLASAEPVADLMTTAPSFLRAAVGAALISVMATPALADAMRFAQHTGYARLVFDFEGNPGFQAMVMGDQLVIQFQQSYDGPLDANVLKGLSGYITQPKLSADKRTLTFDLRRPLTVKSFVNKRSAVIDLVEAAAPVKSQAQTPSPPAAQAAASTVAAAAPVVPSTTQAPSMPALPVRVGSHADFVRLVFDWDRAPDYTASSESGQAQIRFGRDAKMDEAAVRRLLPKAIGDWTLDHGKDGLSIAFTTPEGARLRHYRNGNSVVVDVLAKPDASPVSVAAAKPAPAAPVASASPAAPANPVEAPAVSAVMTPAPVPPARTTASVSLPPEAPAPTPPAAPQASAPTVVVQQSAAVIPPAAVQQPVPAPKPTITPVQAGGMAVAAVADVPVTATTSGKAIAVRLAWASPPPAAMVVRGRSVFLMFGQPVRFELASMKKAGDRLAAIEQIAAPSAAMMRVPLPDGLVPGLERDDRGWTLHLRPVGARRPDVGLPVTIESNTADGSKVVIAVANASAPFDVTDPDTGEILRVMAVSDPGKGIDGERQFAQFRILPSLQGVVIQPRSDAIDIRTAPNQVAIAGGLMVSRLTRSSGVAQVYDFARWLENDVDFTETRQALQRAVAEGDPQNRPTAMFELAQFFLANGHVPDSLAILANLVDGNSQFANDAALKALRGSALLLKGDAAAALADLSDSRLDDDPMVGNWRGMARAKLGEWQAADAAFRKSGLPGNTLPTSMRGEIIVASAEAALRTGDVRRARQITDQLARPDMNPDLRTRGDLVRAESYLQAGDRRAGMPILERVVETDHREIRGIATRLLVEQKLADGSMSLPDAIDRLEKVRYAWGGGDLEYQSLRRLGQLYLQSGDVRAALDRWKEAVTFFPNRPENAQIRAAMTDAFASLYDRATRDRVAPLAALAMYDDFRELTPPGERGDQMIQNLADRLVSIDLLDRAAALLEYQVRNRLTGIDRARVGLRLALVQMIDRQPGKALEALLLSEAPNLPADLVAERKRMKGQALMETGDLAGALAAFETDTSVLADELRAEIHRRGQKWPEAVKALQRVVAAAKDGPLDVPRQKAVLNLAIARALAQDSDGLRQMRDEFGARMQSSQHKQAFELLTSASGDISGIDVVAITQRFAELAEFQTAMASYREKLRGAGLSSIN